MSEVTAADPPLLRGVNLSKEFSARPALRDVSLEVRAGQAVAIVGESGSGKSTLLRLLSGIEAPSKGAVSFMGRPLHALRGADRVRFRRGVQMIFQDPFASLNPTKTIGHHLSRPLAILGVEKARRYAEADVLLESVGLPPGPEFRDRYPHELSGGQRQRVAIARALATQPKAILADEPTSMLDVSLRVGVLNLLTDLIRDRNIALVFVTHDLKSARYVADRLLVMVEGRIVERGPMDEVLARPAHPYTRRLLHSLPGAATQLAENAAAPNPMAKDSAFLNPVADDQTAADAEITSASYGCPYRARCEHAAEICHQQVPPDRSQVRLDGDGSGTDFPRLVRCHRPLWGQNDPEDSDGSAAQSD